MIFTDKERFDWLETGGVWKMHKRHDSSMGCHWPVFFTPTYGREMSSKPTAREAIDAAMIQDGCRPLAAHPEPTSGGGK